MSPRVARALHPGAVLAYADPERTLAWLGPRCLPPSRHVRAVRQLGTRVLEYGSGTGGVTLALARAGLSVVAVDLSRCMLDRFGVTLGREPRAVQDRVRIRHADMRALVLRERFPVVLVADGTFQHLYDAADVRAFLARVRAHLAPGGTLRLDVELPDAATLTRLDRGARYHPLSQILVRQLGDDPGCWLAERQFFPAELGGLLERAGAHLRSLRVVRVPRPAAPSVARLVVHAAWG